MILFSPKILFMVSIKVGNKFSCCHLTKPIRSFWSDGVLSLMLHLLTPKKEITMDMLRKVLVFMALGLLYIRPSGGIRFGLAQRKKERKKASNLYWGGINIAGHISQAVSTKFWLVRTNYFLPHKQHDLKSFLGLELSGHHGKKVTERKDSFQTTTSQFATFLRYCSY